DLGKGFLLEIQAVLGIDSSRLNFCMTTALSGLVRALEIAPQQPIVNIPIMSAIEHQQLLTDYNSKPKHQAILSFDQPAVVEWEYEAPVDEMEMTLAQIWQELLKLERVGRQDNFFRLGGHSLTAIQLLSRMREQ
ncbi:hypothetical protein KKJ22_19770, partial [Xenorhabdus bovienii]|uniref:phosphopantetheine-binding protein n=1 Tax=Xenorhabdus bovienii TaxID=40576 RepID=UPI0023B28538